MRNWITLAAFALFSLLSISLIAGCGGTDQENNIADVSDFGGYNGSYSGLPAGGNLGATGTIDITSPDSGGGVTITLTPTDGNPVVTIQGFVSTGSGGLIYLSGDENGYQISGGGNTPGSLAGGGTIMTSGGTGQFTVSKNSS